MAKAIGDPSEIRRFAGDLRRFSTELQNQLVSLHGRFLALGDSWQDQEHQKFADEFEQAFKVMARFLQASNGHVQHLLRKAERLEEYLSQR